MLRSLLGLVLAVLLVPAAWAHGAYRVQSGDVLQLEVLEDPSLNRSLIVLPDGSVSLPLSGPIRAAGQSIEGLRGAIAAALAPNFATPPTVFLSVGQLNPTTTAIDSAVAAQAAANVPLFGKIAIYAMGEFNTQGRLDVDKGTTLLQFLAETGGLTRFAAVKRIQLRRSEGGVEKIYRYNYKAVQAGAAAPSIVLREGDVIVAPERRLFE